MSAPPSPESSPLPPHFANGVLCHVAIPCLDLEAGCAFYAGVLGATLCRSYEDRKTYGWGNLQIVTHLCSPDDVLWNPQVYPRHFGLTFAEASLFEAMVERCLKAEVPMILPRQIRFPGRREQHLTCIVRDPSHNLIEFKCYDDPAMAF